MSANAPGSTAPDLARLADPFPASDIEWRVMRAGKSKKDESIWALAVAYVTNRAIMERLDSVCGVGGWRNEFAPGPVGGVLCGISILVNGQWVTKYDGAENTGEQGMDMGMAVKGGLSSAMKRAAVQWGIGRYLYKLEEEFAKVHDGGKLRGKLPQKAGGDAFRWDPPALPAWALPPKVEPASESQIGLITKMVRTHVITADERESILLSVGKGMSKDRASDAIEWLTEVVPQRKAAEKADTQKEEE